MKHSYATAILSFIFHRSYTARRPSSVVCRPSSLGCLLLTVYCRAPGVRR